MLQLGQASFLMGRILRCMAVQLQVSEDGGEHVDQEREYERAYEQGDDYERDKESPILGRLDASVFHAAPEQPHITKVGFVDSVEHVADERDGTDEGLEGDVRDHSKERRGRDSKSRGLQHDVGGDSEAGHVPYSRDEPDYGIIAYAIADSGNADGFVEQICEALEPFESWPVFADIYHAVTYAQKEERLSGKPEEPF